MGVEFLTGKIDQEQVVIPRHMRSPELSALRDGECSYISDTSFWMDADGKLWVDILTTSIKDLVPVSESDFVRVMKIPEGFVVDVSQVIKNFRDPETGELMFTPQEAPENAAEGFTFQKAPVIGFLTSEGEVEIFRELVKAKYDYDYPIAHEATDT